MPIGHAWSTLGNLGFSTSKCLTIPLSIGAAPLNCAYGKIGEVKHFGVTPSDAKVSNMCVVDSTNEKCSSILSQEITNTLNECRTQASCPIVLDANTVYKTGS